MNVFDDNKDEECNGDGLVEPDNKDTQVQLVISLGLGVTAFLLFCILRPRWKTLYAARRRRFDPNVGLPHLPDSFLGWIPALYRVTEDQVLASAGLDAFVFLSFFKMAVRLFAVMFFFAAAVLEPINQVYVPEYTRNSTRSTPSFLSNVLLIPEPAYYAPVEPSYAMTYTDKPDPPDNSWNYDMSYLWAYLIFTYFFTGLTVYFMDKETFKIIQVRQDYLGTQSTITDRTFRITGIPKAMKSEEQIKELVEKLEIGRVESVTLCRNWKELDNLVAERNAVLRKLEETWSVYLGQKPRLPVGASGRPSNDDNPGAQEPGGADEEAGENGRLMGTTAHQLEERQRPTTRIWYGLLRLQSKKSDGINYFEEKLRRLDEKIRAARKKNYAPADLAFVTMDSIAACQMATQALLDPRPGHLIPRLAPAPSDVVWRNTYAPRMNLRVQSWLITAFITVLSIIWLVPVASIASLLSLCTIKKWWPELAESLGRHDITKALVQTGLPTAVVSLLNIAVPYLYDYLSNHQGMLSQGDVELSVISKNFFFTFFNIFLVFTVFGTATRFWTVLRSSLRDTTYIAYSLAREIQRLSVFYLNFIMLQGLGLFPFRLLEFGSVALYPIYRMGARTPRDFAQIVEPPLFNYGFYLPTALLVFILCLVYSVLPRGFLVLLLGLVYFGLGYFTYKYQLLYAMDQPQHATGGAWRIICYRIILGLVVFQLTMSGVLALNSAFTEALLVVPLLLFTVWYSFHYKRIFEPLTRFIALRSIRRDTSAVGGVEGDAVDEEGGRGVDEERAERQRRIRRTSTIDEDREKGLRFVNPSLVVPLEQPWVYHDPPPLIPEESENGEDPTQGYTDDPAGGSNINISNNNNGGNTVTVPSRSGSEFSLGDTHIWRDGGDNNA